MSKVQQKERIETKRSSRLLIWLANSKGKWKVVHEEDHVFSSGSLFIDLGYSPEEAAILQMRADLTAELKGG
jgi:hypothetical protein